MARNPTLARNPQMRNPREEMRLTLRLSELLGLPHRVYRVLGRLLSKEQTERLFS